MKHLMQYMRQLHQRRINAYFFSDTEEPSEQLTLRHVSHRQDRTRSAREMFADVEYDNEDERI